MISGLRLFSTRHSTGGIPSDQKIRDAPARAQLRDPYRFEPAAGRSAPGAFPGNCRICIQWRFAAQYLERHGAMSIFSVEMQLIRIFWVCVSCLSD